jgi:uncharacterized protein YqgC (DUF456 family)
MEIFAFILWILFSLLGFVAIFFTPFGTLTILIGSGVYAIMTQFAVISGATFLCLLVIYALGEIWEYLAVALGTKIFGASKRAMWGALGGGLLGAILGFFLFGIGALLGSFLGIFLGAFMAEWSLHKDLLKSIKAGAGGVFGRVGAIAGKVCIALLMLGIVGVQVFRFYF